MKQPAIARRIALIVIACTLVLTAVWIWLRLTNPSDGARLAPGQAVWRDNGVVVTPLETESGGLQQGDVVIAVEGRSLESWTEGLFRLGTPSPQWHAGQTVTYTVLRSGHLLDIPIRLGSYPLGTLIQDEWGILAFMLVFALTGAYVFLRRPNDLAARTLFQSSWSLLVTIPWVFGLQISDLIGGPSFWLYDITVLGMYILFWISLLHFTLVFPTQHRFITRHPWIVPLIYVVPFACYFVYLAVTAYMAPSLLSWIGQWEPSEAALGLPYVALGITVMITNYRASRDTATRQKISWVVLATVISSGGAAILWIFPTDVLRTPLISPNVLGLLLFPFPVGIAIAILRYRLFDIDVLINRALVYGLLTVTLALVYVGCVIALQSVTVVLKGQISQNPLTIVASTLISVALFQPLRTRIQRGIDRRFYRHKYDAARTIEAFSATLRNQVELNKLSEQLVAVVNETMQPTQVWLWLRPPQWQTEEQAYRLEAHSPELPSIANSDANL